MTTSIHPQRLYHGTIVENLRQVLPSSATGREPVFRIADCNFAYATEDPSHAWHYAELAWHHASQGVPRVYEVTALGEVEVDPFYDDHGTSRSTFDDDRRCTAGFTVIRELPMPDHMGSPAAWA